MSAGHNEAINPLDNMDFQRDYGAIDPRDFGEAVLERWAYFLETHPQALYTRDTSEDRAVYREVSFADALKMDDPQTDTVPDNHDHLTFAKAADVVHADAFHDAKLQQQGVAERAYAAWLKDNRGEIELDAYSGVTVVVKHDEEEVTGAPEEAEQEAA